MKNIGILFVLLTSFAAATLLSNAASASKPNSGSYYANIQKLELDPNLPEPFARTQSAQVMVNFDSQDATLLFSMGESEGIDVTFPITSDKTDSCNNREIIATPPSNSTPYYKDFEIKIIDYSENSCGNIKIPAPTFVSFKSYEVGKKTTTLSRFFADKLIKYIQE